MDSPSTKTEQKLLKEQNQRLSVLSAALAKAQKTAPIESETFFAALVQETRKLLACQGCALILFDEASPSTPSLPKNADNWIIRKALNIIETQKPASKSKPLEWTYQASPRLEKGLIQECLNSQATINSPQGAQDARFDPANDGLGELPIHNMLCAPVVCAGASLGVIQAVNKHPQNGMPRTFDSSDQDVLSMAAGILGYQLSNAQLAQQLEIASADQQASQWELERAQNTWEALFNGLLDASYIIDPHYRISAINQKRALRANQAVPDLIGEVCHQALYQRDQPCPKCRVKESLTLGETTKRNEQRYADANNQRFNESLNSAHKSDHDQGEEQEHRWSEDSSEWEIYSYPIMDQDQHPVLAILLERDITEKRQLEDILTQSEKLAAMGQLAAGIAHEINNPLTAIIANAQLLRRSLPPKDDLQESVDLIARAGARAVQVVRNLLDFARKEEYHLGLTNINDTLERALELIQHEILARSVRLEFKPDPDLPLILASQDHLQSVWLNLVLNAVDSLDKSPSEIKIITRRSTSEIIVTVSDNGKGIAAERLARIFEPFYTTKAPGRGTGLGLSVSHRIVKQHGGHIRVESQVGKGSVFTVVLPLN